VLSYPLYDDQWPFSEVLKKSLNELKRIPVEIMDGVLLDHFGILRSFDFSQLSATEISILYDRSKNNPESREILLRSYLSGKFNFSPSHLDEVVNFTRKIDRSIGIKTLSEAFRLRTVFMLQYGFPKDILNRPEFFEIHEKRIRPSTFRCFIRHVQSNLCDFFAIRFSIIPLIFFLLRYTVLNEIQLLHQESLILCFGIFVFTQIRFQDALSQLWEGAPYVISSIPRMNYLNEFWQNYLDFLKFIGIFVVFLAFS